MQHLRDISHSFIVTEPKPAFVDVRSRIFGPFPKKESLKSELFSENCANICHF